MMTNQSVKPTSKPAGSLKTTSSGLRRYHQKGWLAGRLNPYRLISLMELLEVYASHYIDIGIAIEQICGSMAANLTPEEPLTDPVRDFVLSKIDEIIKHTIELDLAVSLNMTGEIRQKYKDGQPTHGEARNDFGYLRMALYAELKSKHFFFMPPERFRYFATPPDLTNLWSMFDGLAEGLSSMSECLDKFPSIDYDLREAGNCYAFGRFTACVIHSMRVLEYGLASLASALSVPIKNPNWHQILQACEKQIVGLINHDPNWKQNEQFYNGVALEFRHFQRALRNHAAHAGEKYTADEAKVAMDHVASFMKHLSTRLDEVPMP